MDTGRTAEAIDQDRRRLLGTTAGIAVAGAASLLHSQVAAAPAARCRNCLRWGSFMVPSRDLWQQPISASLVLRETSSRWAVPAGSQVDPRTVGKMLEFSVPPGYRRSKPPVKPKLGPFIGIIDVILAEDKGRPKKQQHTSNGFLSGCAMSMASRAV